MLNGIKTTELANIYKNMINSCYNENNQMYRGRGSIGIEVCPTWKNDREAFYKWCIDKGWVPGAKVRRIDTTKNFSPRNCVVVDGKFEVDYALKHNRARKDKTQISYRATLKHRWHDMIDRCYKENNCNYANYGARGIRVCDEWIGENGFENFSDWAIENNFHPSFSIDRIDVNGNYSPANCRWATKVMQEANKQDTERYEYDGNWLTIAQIAKLEDIPTSFMRKCIEKKGMSVLGSIAAYYDSLKK